MSRIFSFVIASAILGSFSGIGRFFSISLAPEPTRTELPPQIPFAQTGLVSAGYRSHTGLRGSGTVRPSAEIGIAPQVGGKIDWVDPGFQSGGRVTAGQSDHPHRRGRTYLYRVREAEANLATRRVALLEEEEKADPSPGPNTSCILSRPGRFGFDVSRESPHAEGASIERGACRI